MIGDELRLRYVEEQQKK